MGNITLNKPSGGQLTIAPEDGTSNETVEIPSVGVGKVLQVDGFNLNATNWNTTSTSYVESVLAMDFTPLRADSTIIVSVFGSVHYDADTSHGRGQIRKDGAVVSGYDNDDLLAYIAGHSSGRGHPFYMTLTDKNVGTTSSVRYAYYVRSQVSSAPVHVYRNVGMTIMEVAA